MKFRLSVQPKPTRQELKSIAPSLLSDPAFSPDPHSNPYFVLNGEPAWASSPPVGHPALKSRNRRQPSNFAHPISATDFDFDLIPPPNSPVAPSAIPTTTHFPFPTTQSSSTKPESPPAAPRGLPPPVATPTGAVANTSSPPPRQGTKGKKRRMPFLTRRKSSAQPTQPARPAAKQNLVPTQSARADNDVTQRPRPAPAPCNVSEQPTSAKSFAPRPAFPLRSATVSGVSTPNARSAGKSSAPSQISNARTQDLDRIDELDETNPWGIALHHGGPYEAAVQALRSANNSMATGTGSSMLNDYPRQALHAHGNIYVPPQVPTGVSLNLSPGQILPRNFDISPQAQYPRRQATVGPSSHRKPPSILVPGTPASRRQSQPLPLLSPGPLPNPHSMLSPMLPRDPPLPKREPQPEPEAELEPEPDRAEDVSFNIGMAMLQPSASASSTPSIYLHPETSDDSEFDPYDPIHLEREHPRTPSPLVISSAEQSRGPSPDPDPQPQRLIPQPSIFRNASENPNPDTLRQQGSTPQDHNTPPPYHDVVLDPEQHLQPIAPQEKSRSSSRQPSPGPASSASHGNSHSDEAGHSQTRLPERSTNDILPSPADQWETSRDLQFASQMPPAQSSRERVYNLGPPPVQDRDARSTHQVAQMPPARSSHEHIYILGPPPVQERDLHNTDQVALPPTRSREHVQNLGPPPVQDRDARSTHHTISTYTSSQMRNGPPPPHRRVPKHLVMPTPLNNNPNNGMVQTPARLPPQSFPPAQFGPTRVQVQVRAQPHTPYAQHTHYAQAPQSFAPVQPNPISQAKPLINSSKLRKKLSTKMTPSPATNNPPPQIVTTVSFAPPVIGFGQSSSAEKLIGRSKTEKIPKRVLSKRRTDF